MNTKWLVLGGVALFAAGFGLAFLLGDRKVEVLQQFSDSVATISNDRAAAIDSLKKAANDSAAVLAAQRDAAKGSARRSRQRADSLQVTLETATSDTQRVRILLGVNLNLRKSNDSLSQALTLAEAEARVMRANRDSIDAEYQKSITRINQLNERIQELTPRMPQWLRTTLRITEIAGAAYAGYKCGEQRCL